MRDVLMLALAMLAAVTVTLPALAVVAWAAEPPQAVSAARRIAIPVPSVAIAAGQVISDDMLSDRDVPDSVGLDAKFHTNRAALAGMTARKPLAPGRAIALAAVKPTDLVVPGQPVTLIYVAPGLEITGRAMPLQPGKRGDVVQVRNLDSGRVVQGVVKDAGAVQIRGE